MSIIVSFECCRFSPYHLVDIILQSPMLSIESRNSEKVCQKRLWLPREAFREYPSAPGVQVGRRISWKNLHPLIRWEYGFMNFNFLDQDFLKHILDTKLLKISTLDGFWSVFCCTSILLNPKNDWIWLNHLLCIDSDHVVVSGSLQPWASPLASKEFHLGFLQQIFWTKRETFRMLVVSFNTSLHHFDELLQVPGYVLLML